MKGKENTLPEHNLIQLGEPILMSRKRQLRLQDEDEDPPICQDRSKRLKELQANQDENMIK